MYVNRKTVLFIMSHVV